MGTYTTELKLIKQPRTVQYTQTSPRPLPVADRPRCPASEFGIRSQPLQPEHAVNVNRRNSARVVLNHDALTQDRKTRVCGYATVVAALSVCVDLLKLYGRQVWYVLMILKHSGCQLTASAIRHSTLVSTDPAMLAQHFRPSGGFR